MSLLARFRSTLGRWFEVNMTILRVVTLILVKLQFQIRCFEGPNFWKTTFFTQKANICREWSFWGKMTKSGVIFGIFHFEGHSRWSKLSKKGYFSSLKRRTVLEKDTIKWLPKWLLATILYKNHFKFHLLSCPYINLYFYKSTF